ncbi:MAG TPA: effector-associated domain EAD1-containing protein [Chloroflexota bacterium]|nr:effector-associated domain EAD1-containing protein [Chloroflexota bacterium]
MRLNGRQYERLVSALVDAYPTVFRLRQMLRYRLDKNLDTIALGDDLLEIAFKLVQAGEAEGWTSNLVLAARESNTGSPDLLALAEELGLASSSVSNNAIESIIRASNSFLDVEVWRERLGQVETQVCRVELPTNRGHIYGTGFLIAPDLVITNYHVMEAAIRCTQKQRASEKAEANPADVVLRFDFRRLGDGTVLDPGTEYRLPPSDWLLDYSPRSTVQDNPPIDELDYAIVRVAGSPGLDSVGKGAEPEADSRGWIRLRPDHHHFRPGTPLLIMQHPNSAPLKLSIDTDAIVGVNTQRTLVTYRANTLPGSSGSPCFDINWNLVAVHHSGDPGFLHTGLNSGTPTDAIWRLLDKRGIAAPLPSD